MQHLQLARERVLKRARALRLRAAQQLRHLFGERFLRGKRLQRNRRVGRNAERGLRCEAGFVEAAEFVDEPDLQGLCARPDASATDLFDGVGLHAAALGDARDELFVHALDVSLQQLARARGKRLAGE